MSHNLARKVVGICVLSMVIQIAVIGYVFYTGYAGRSDLVDSQRNSCAQRGKLDRRAVILVSTNVLTAFKETDKRVGLPLTKNRISAEWQIQNAINGLNARNKVPCAKVFPKARILP